MKLKADFKIVDINGQKTLVPINLGDYTLILKLNDVAVDIINLLKEETTEDKIVKEMLKIYNASEADIRKSVTKVIEKLNVENLLTK